MIDAPPDRRFTEESSAAFLQIGWLKIPLVTELDVSPCRRLGCFGRGRRAIETASGRRPGPQPDMAQRTRCIFGRMFEIDGISRALEICKELVHELIQSQLIGIGTRAQGTRETDQVGSFSLHL